MVSEYDSARRDYIQTKYKMIVEVDNNEVVKFADVIILAVKPKDFEVLLKQEVCCGLSEKKLLISIAAGVTTKHIEDVVGSDVPVIRAMPNMGALIGEAVTSLSRGNAASQKDIETATEIFSLIGEVVEVDEKLVDAVTAVSGSGPAYFFYIIESMIAAGVALGLDEKTAAKLVTKTALGSARLLEALKEDPAVLRKKVTSKGGTTEAAIAIFEKKKIKSIINDAIKAASKRSRELSKG
jgi:pyrroline-5-carboxylate reductase